MAKKSTAFIRVTLKLPEGATEEDARSYVEAAVKEWRGSLEPPGVDSGDGTLTDGDPMFSLDPDSVIVKVWL